MTVWRPIATAPQDDAIRAAVALRQEGCFSPALTMRYVGHAWCFWMGGSWHRADPQPTHWKPLEEPPGNPPVKTP